MDWDSKQNVTLRVYGWISIYVHMYGVMGMSYEFNLITDT